MHILDENPTYPCPKNVIKFCYLYVEMQVLTAYIFEILNHYLFKPLLKM